MVGISLMLNIKRVGGNKMAKEQKKTLMEFMAEERSLSRWLLVVVALFGAFWGAILALMITYLGLVG